MTVQLFELVRHNLPITRPQLVNDFDTYYNRLQNTHSNTHSKLDCVENYPDRERT